MQKSEFYDLIWDETGVQRSRITDDARFLDDLGCDSLAVVELVIALEEHFGVAISDQLADSWATVGDVWRWVDGRGD